MYSRELRELDHNTVQLMIDLMQEDLEKQKATTKELQEQLSQQSEQISQQSELLYQKDEKIRELQEALERAMQQKQE